MQATNKPERGVAVPAVAVPAVASVIVAKEDMNTENVTPFPSQNSLLYRRLEKSQSDFKSCQSEDSMVLASLVYGKKENSSQTFPTTT